MPYGHMRKTDIDGKDELTMVRNTDLREAFFPVVLIDLYANVEHLGGPKASRSKPGWAGYARDRYLPGFDIDSVDGDLVEFQRLPKYRAVVNKENGEILSVVTTSYKLVTNEEAVALAEQAFKAVFSATDTNEMTVFNVRQSSRKTICQVDLVHRNYRVAVLQDDIWVPFLRVTNSYNKSRALQFDLGFSRKYCDNGCIFEEDTFRVKYYHTKSATKPVLEGAEKFQRLEELQKEFVNHLHQLEKVPFPAPLLPALVARVFKLHFSDETEKKRKRRVCFLQHVGGLIEKYATDLGQNGYLALNVLTDFATRPPEEVFVAADFRFHSLQKSVGSWLPVFLREVSAGEFSIEDYLGDYLDLVA